MKTVKFDCPRPWIHGKHKATLFSSGRAGCPIHGWLLYTEIQREARIVMRKKLGGWKTYKDFIPPKIYVMGTDPSGERALFIRLFKLFIKIPLKKRTPQE